jgi:hypothetical protein
MHNNVHSICFTFQWPGLYYSYVLPKPISRVLEKPPVTQLLKNFQIFYGILRFIAVFTRLRQWSLSWAWQIHYISPHHISLRSNLIIFLHLRINLPISLFPSRFAIKSVYGFLFCIRATCSAHRILLDFIILVITGEEYMLWSSSLSSFLRSYV